MLWAQFQPQNDAEAAGFVVGIVIAGLVSGGIPFFTGLAMRQVSLGIAGGIVSAGAGALAGCCGGIPVAAICTMVIVLVANSSGRPVEHSPFTEPLQEEYDDYARAFQLPGRDGDRRRGDDRRQGDRRRSAEGTDRRREVHDDLRRRAEEEDRYRERGFRPRKRDLDQDD
jgi:hypothetical protein